MRIPMSAGLTGLAAVTLSLAAEAGGAAPAAAPAPPLPGAATPVDVLLRASQAAGPVAGPRPLLPTRLLERPRRPRERDRERPRTAFPIRGAQAGYGEAIARFGVQRSGHVHQGQDVFAPAGARLVAVRAGEVLETGSDGGRGNYIALYSAQRDRTYVYFHMQAPSHLSAGRRVRAGQAVGRVGCTGSCTGDHLHFEIHKGRTLSGAAVDPLPMLRRWRS